MSRPFSGAGMLSRWRPAVAALVAVASVVILSALVLVRSAPTPSGDAALSAESASGSGAWTGDAARTVRAPSGTAPKRPIARRCGRAGKQGPSKRPTGARRVTPAMNLPRMAANAPRGTTFWLTRGTHTLGNGEYDQVRPRRGQRFVGAPGAVIDGRRTNLYAFGGRAENVTVEHLTIQNFGRAGTTMNEGVVNHDAAHGWRVRNNTVRRNAGAGVFVGTDNVVSRNCLAYNGQYGFSVYERTGVRRVKLTYNEITGNNTHDWERRRPGCGCTGGGKFWDTRRATIVGNWIHDNRSVGIWADTNNTGFTIRRNYFARNDGPALMYETSYNARIVRNTFVRNAIRDGRRERGFPTAAIYLSESGSDPRAGERYGRTFRIAGNRFVDNWSALIAWENADRFAGSPANTSSDYTTLVNPRVATVKACSDPDKIARKPYYDDCRWKVKNLLVHHNVIRFDPARMPDACRPGRGCGYVGLFSNWGSYPSWSPYKGLSVERAITFRQNNRWVKNRYVGPTRFMARELWKTVSWKSWRAAPFRQDRGSVKVRR
ncbi:parallel beta helix pectate lyase-like protein [Mumia flava]|uniref:Parallel beta helix pectate lyase-like protein n=1 Tax=Mumia flava TaxID=1348852 RepID=A0A2M9BFY3_9ACTN|nr:right-handed parallel beta-helix repeat-containing protein [Mumia flava]PJJ56858.1 parallel beta helix pectate lyase-like protein [Mumia flava]